jgi:hypothetical protein
LSTPIAHALLTTQRQPDVAEWHQATQDETLRSGAVPTRPSICPRRVPGSWTRRYPTVSLGDQGLRRGIQAGTCSRYTR